MLVRLIALFDTATFDILLRGSFKPYNSELQDVTTGHACRMNMRMYVRHQIMIYNIEPSS